MLVTNIFSGLLAAVMVALGAGQIGNNNTQVGEELVVEEVNTSVLAPMWFELQTTGDPTLPTNQNVIKEGNSSNSCNGSGAICEVHLETSSIPSTTLDELYERIEQEDYPTVQDFLDAGASYTSPQPVYTHHN